METVAPRLDEEKHPMNSRDKVGNSDVGVCGGS